MDYPYSPSAFKHCQYKFGKYLNYIRLAAFRHWTWKDSDEVEECMAEWFKGRI
jgi:hypothetical protein